MVSQPAADPDAGSRREELAPISCATCSTPSATTRELPDDAAAAATAEEAAAELSKDSPDISRFRQLLGKLALAAGPVSEIAAAIITVERAITGTL